MAVPGEFLWPFPGTSRGRPRGIFMTACGEFLMAIDRRELTLVVMKASMSTAVTVDQSSTPPAPS